MAPNLTFQTTSLVYQKVAQFATMSAAIIELHRAGKTNSEIIKLL